MTAQRILILDGGLGTELKRRGVRLHPVCWSALANLHNAEIVQQIHEDYLHAGADVITANTMMSGKHVLESMGMRDFQSLNRRAVTLARCARDASGKQDSLIAGSMSILPPMDNHSCLFRGAKAVEGYRRQAETLVDAGVDILLAEMLIDSRSAREILSACCDTGLPVWAGFSARKESETGKLMSFRQPGTLASEPHEDFKQLSGVAGEFPISVAGVMHTDPQQIPEALHQLGIHWQGSLMAYGNLGVADKHDWIFSEGHTAEHYAALATQWVEDFNLDIVGGCCGTTPQVTQRLREQLTPVVS